MPRPRRQYVVITFCPHTSAHFWEAASEVRRGTYAECERGLRPGEHIWRADFWDRKES